MCLSFLIVSPSARSSSGSRFEQQQHAQQYRRVCGLQHCVKHQTPPSLRAACDPRVEGAGVRHVEEALIGGLVNRALAAAG